jgi:hypothetical protein
VTDEIHVPVWGTYITTPHVSDEYAAVRLETTVDNLANENVRVQTEIVNAANEVVAQKNEMRKLMKGQAFVQNFTVNNPSLWSPETPVLYKAVSKIYVKDQLVDEYTTRFGIRSVQVIANKGFFLNGKLRKFQGVCNHHDLGPLGAAVNVAALKRQLTLLKEMGCDAIRTAHNMPAPELVALCDEMGFMMMIEPFDEWDRAKCDNGYHRFFNDWAEKDMVNMLRNYRNNASVVCGASATRCQRSAAPMGIGGIVPARDLSPRRSYTSGNLRHGSGDLCAGQWLCCFVGCSGFNYGCIVTKRLTANCLREWCWARRLPLQSARGACISFPLRRKPTRCMTTISLRLTTWSTALGLTCPTMIWPWPKIMTGDGTVRVDRF